MDVPLDGRQAGKPTRPAKSTIATIYFPCWVWASCPSQNFLSASYSLDLSTEHSVMRSRTTASRIDTSIEGQRQEGLSLGSVAMIATGGLIAMLWAVAHRREYRPVIPPEAGSATNRLHQE